MDMIRFAVGNAAHTMNTATNWSVGNFLTNLNSQLVTWGGLLVTLIGVVMVIVAVFKIAKGLMSGGRGQTNWVLNILLFFIGGAMAFSGGWNLVKTISDGGTSTLKDLGTMLPLWKAYLGL